MLDLDKLPEKYRFNSEPLTEGKYIDDNSLFVYSCISRGMFSFVKNADMTFLYLQPFEWTSIDFIAFLLQTSREYGFEINTIKSNFLAIEDEYEVSMTDSFGQPDVFKIAQYQKMVADAVMKHHDKRKPFTKPKWYEGAYKWILELKETNPEREEVVLFEKFSTDTATVADLERALIYANRIAPVYPDEDSERYLSKHLFKTILDYTTFFIAMDEVQTEKLKKDIDDYLEAFIQDKLIRNNSSKTIGTAQVSQSENIFTFKKHSSLFREYLQKMQNDYGNTFTIENPFEDRFPNYEYPDKDVIRARFAKRNFYFIHILLAFKKLGLLKITMLGSNWDFYEDKMLTYQAKVELLPAFTNEEQARKLHFDADKSRFYVQGKVVKLMKYKDEYHTLRVMFENPEELLQEWFFSDIAERVDDARVDDKKYYNAIYQIRLKLEKEGIKDFFITTKQSVKINPKYLS